MQFRKSVSLGQSPGAVMALVFMGLIGIVGAKVLTQTNAMDYSSNAINATIGNASAGITQVTSQMPLIGLIIGLAIVIRILWGSFGGMFSSGAGSGL